MRALTTVSLLGFALLPLSTSSSAQTLLGPSPYLSRSDSPFSDCVQLETFEDHLFNQPGVTADVGFVTGTVYTSSLIDSVDADDGDLDGSGSFGDSYFSGGLSVTFTFSAAVLGGLPTRAGLVWTDGSGTTSFEAFGPTGTSLGVLGPVSIADGSFSGGTAEDTFFGVESSAGISAIKISNTGGALELDHLQYALTSGPSVTASETVRLGTPPNPNALKQSKATPPILGTTWAPYVDHASFVPTAAFDFLAVSFGPPLNVPLSIGTLLCTPPAAGLIFAAAAGSPFKLPIPDTCSLAGAPGCSQAASLTATAAIQLTNALDFVIGTH
jgi:hypothetical protein